MQYSGWAIGRMGSRVDQHYPLFQEQIEVIRRYIHPEYKYPELHSDVALLELGRRVEFKLEEFGDTPTCLDKGLDLPGKVATAQVDFLFDLSFTPNSPFLSINTI